MNIRFARETDASRLLSIYRPYVEKTAYSFEWEPPTPEEFAGRIRRIAQTYPYLVAEENGEALGYAYADRVFERTAYQWVTEYSVYLAENARGRGLGRRLYGCLNALCRAQGFTEAYAVITSANAPSLAFHEKQGFSTFAIFPRCGFKQGAWWNVTWMRRPLRPCSDAPEAIRPIDALEPAFVRAVLRSWAGKGPLPEGFAYLDEAIPGVRWEAKYAGSDNFTGRPVDGYRANRVAGTLEMLSGLLEARDAAKEEGLSLLVWDAYRPCRAVADFMRWAAAPEDGKTRAAHYPRLTKNLLFKEGYIAEKSGHSRGSTVDLTLADAQGRPLDMGGIFDLMDERSHHGSPDATPGQKENRSRLLHIMQRAGFLPYENEWWHYRLDGEPYPNEYFDFVIG